MKRTTLADEMRDMRQARGLTAAQAGELAGIHRVNWTQIESGTRDNPSLSTLEGIARALNCAVAILPDGSVELQPLD